MVLGHKLGRRVIAYTRTLFALFGTVSHHFLIASTLPAF